MNLIDRVGSDTIGKLERAAPRRLAEAVVLAAQGHYLAAIYLCGYVAEMVLGAAFYRLDDYGSNEPIDDNHRRRVLGAARGLKLSFDPSHPLDGLAILLVNKKRQVGPSGYKAEIERGIVNRVNAICRHWAPKLRYRDLDASRSQAQEVIDAAGWLLSEYPSL
jgi:hypothetical protein